MYRAISLILQERDIRFENGTGPFLSTAAASGRDFIEGLDLLFFASREQGEWMVVSSGNRWPVITYTI